MKRRAFMKAALATAIAGPAIICSKKSRASGWADMQDLPAGQRLWAMRDEDRPVQRILEIYLYGGLSPWETFHLDTRTRLPGGSCDAAASCPAVTARSGTQYGTFQCAFEQTMRAEGQSTFTHPFDGNIHLGPATWPIWQDEIVNRMRVLVMSHDLRPHEAAIPYALTGSRLGRPNFAGTGAAVMHRFPSSAAPAAYVVQPGQAVNASDNVSAALATGQHDAACMPLLIEVLAPHRVVGTIQSDGRVPPPSAELNSMTPTELRAALLLALGINPFAFGNFAVGSLTEYFKRGGEAGARTLLKEQVLGYR